MKKIVSVLLFSILALGCNKDSMAPQKGAISFSFSSSPNSSARMNSSAKEPAAVLLSIVSSNGASVYENKKLQLYSFGSSYISENLMLQTGGYNLTQFVVLDADNKVIYATPVEGSDLAQFVNDPLPIKFSVNENQTTQVTPQVLAVTDDTTPEQFGYVSFGFEVVNINSTSIREYEIFEFNNDKGTYFSKEKWSFYYDNSKRLIRKEYFSYLNMYEVYYRTGYETFEYNSSGTLNKAYYFNGSEDEPLWKYVINYPSSNEIKWDWFTHLSGYPDELYFSKLYSRLGNDFTMSITEFPTEPSQSKYRANGVFSEANNIVISEYYDFNGTTETLNASYDSKPNPLFNFTIFLSPKTHLEQKLLLQQFLITIQFTSSTKTTMLLSKGIIHTTTIAAATLLNVI